MRMPAWKPHNPAAVMSQPRRRLKEIRRNDFFVAQSFLVSLMFGHVDLSIVCRIGSEQVIRSENYRLHVFQYVL